MIHKSEILCFLGLIKTMSCNACEIVVNENICFYLHDNDSKYKIISDSFNS